MFLSPQRGCLDIIQARDIRAPRRFDSHLVKLGVLLDHCGDDTEERFV